MVKVGYENWWGSLALSILLTNRDFEIFRSALLITSFPILQWGDPCSCLYLPFSNLSWREDVENPGVKMLKMDGVLNLWRYEWSLLSPDPSIDGGDESLLPRSFRRSFLHKRSTLSSNFRVSWLCETWLPVLKWLLSVHSVWYDSTITLSVWCLSLLRAKLTNWFPFVNQRTPLYYALSWPWLLRINPQ